MLPVYIAIIFIVLILWDYLQKRPRYQALKKAKIVGPTTLPILGCAIQALDLGAENLLQYFGDCFQQYGQTFRLWILNEAQIYTTDIKYFEHFLSSPNVLTKGDLYVILRSWLNDGLLLSAGQKWHSRRKIFTPAFHFNVLEHYTTIFDEQSGVLCRKLLPLADGKVNIDMLSTVCLTALDVMTEASMGVKVNAQSDPEFPYVKALKSVVYALSDGMLKLNHRYPWLHHLTAPKSFHKLRTDIKIMHDFTIEIIEERRSALAKSIKDGTYKPLLVGDDKVGSKNQLALLDILLQSTINGRPLSNEDIREEVDTFMFEGDDTTTSAVSHAIYSISRHPRIQEKLMAEIIEIIGKDKDASVSMRQLQDLKYMDLVIKETLRLFPSVPSIGRKIEKDIEIDGKIFPANTSIYFVLYWAHRNPNLFHEPNNFYPERFETHEVGIKPNPYMYIPFSAGPKNCIGQKFAILEIKAILSKIMRYYEILPSGIDLIPMFNLILRSSTGINVALKPRTY